MNTFQNKNIFFSHSEDETPQQPDFSSHMHNEYEILYFISGDADYVIGSSTYRLQSGDLLFIKPTVYHYLKLRSSAPYQRFIINFADKILPQNLLAELDSYGELYRFAKEKQKAMEYMFYLMDYISKNFSAGNAVFAILQELNVLLLNLKNFSFDNNQNPGKKHKLLDAILTYIDKNLTSDLNGEILSKEFFISPSWISHTFCNYFGIGVMQYINRKKILYAQQLIKTGVLPTKAAELCGYGNYSTFYRQYKEFLNTEPVNDKWIKEDLWHN